MLKKVRHHNLIGHEINISLDMCSDDKSDREIYCRKLHAIVEPLMKDCESCPYLSGIEQGNGIECTWEDECEDDYVVFHEDRFKEYKRVDRLIKSQKEKEDCECFRISVYFAMSEEQAEKTKMPVCLQPSLPDSENIYFKIDRVPCDLCEEKKKGWEKSIKVKKQNICKVLNFLYPDGYDFDVDEYLSKIHGDYVRIIGFGD